MAVEKRYYWLTRYLTFSATIFIATSFNIGGIFAGRIASFLQPLQKDSPWLFLLYPLLLTAKGNISGVLSGKIGTELHLGTIKPTWKNNTQRFKQLLGLIFSLTIINVLLVSFVTVIFGLIFQIEVDFLAVLVICLTTFALTLTIGGGLTIILAFEVFNRGRDPDTLLYPMMATFNDIVVSLFLVLLYHFYTKTRLTIYIIGLPLTLFSICGMIYFLIKWKQSEFFKQSFSQSLPILFVTTLIAAFTGTVLSSFEDVIHATIFLLVVYPAIIDTLGAQGSIIVNTTTTKLHLGTIEAKLSSLKNKTMIVFLSSIITVGIILNAMHTLLGILITRDAYITNYFRYMSLLVITNIIAFGILGTIALSVAFACYKLGLDPDNIVMPVQASLADLLVTIIFVLMAGILL